MGNADRLRLYLASKDSGTWDEAKKVGWKSDYGKDTFKLTDKQSKEILDSMPTAEKEVGDRLVKAAVELEQVNIGEGILSLASVAIREQLAVRDRVNELEYKLCLMELEIKKLKESEKDGNQ